MPTAVPSPITVVSARPDGASSIAAATAAVLSQAGRTLLVDLNLDRPEQAVLLDLDDSPNLFHLAYRSKLGPASSAELEDHLQWRDGIAVLPGIARSDDAVEVTDAFIDGLVATAARSYEHVVLDAGRPRLSLPSSLTAGVILWVIAPSPLGLAALDKAAGALEEAQSPWLARARVILNRVSERSLTGVERFVEREHGLRPAGQIPAASDFWADVELSHSLRALTVPMPTGDRYVKAYGGAALAVRRAIESMLDSLREAEGAVGHREVIEV